MLISLVIPCREEKDSLVGLLQDIADQQVSFETEIIRVVGVSPVSKARNNGAKMAKGQIFVFIDSDIRLGDKRFLANLIAPLLRASGVGMSSASIRIPPQASGFQIRYARQMPHAESPVVDAVTEVSVAASACCAIRPDLFFSLGGFEDRIARGEDSLLSLRVKKAGQRVVLAPHTWCFHPQPDNLIELIKIQFRNGQGVASVDALHPDFNIDVDPRGITYEAAQKTSRERIGRFLKSLYQAALEGKTLLVLSKLCYLFGYGYGMVRFGLSARLRNEKNYRILIINLGGLGDFLLSFPALKALRQHYPRAEISLLVTPKIYEIAKMQHWHDSIFVFHMKYGGIVPFFMLAKNTMTLLRLRMMGMDMAVNMRSINSRESARKIKLLLDIICPKIKVGRDTEGRGYFFDVKSTETDAGQKHEREYNVDTLAVLGIAAGDTRIDLETDARSTARARGFLEKEGVSEKDVLVGIHPGGLPAHRWPIKYFLLLLREISAHRNCTFLITGGDNESSLAGYLLERHQGKVINAAGRLTLPELIAVIKRCNVYITNDTGPMHIAAIVHTPLVAIFGPGDLSRFDPRHISDKAVVVHHATDCAPCNREDCQTLKCLEAVTVAEVAAAVRNLLPYE